MNNNFRNNINNSFRYNHMFYENPEQSDYYSHMHNDYELFYFMGGDAEYIIGSSIYQLEKYDLLLIKPLTYHHLHLRSSEPYERTHFNFLQKDVLAETLPFLENEDVSPIFHIPPENPIRRIFEELKEVQEVYSETEFNYFKHSALNLILLHLKYDYPSITPKSAKSVNFANNDVLQNIIQFINDNSDKVITVNDLANRFYMSPSWIVHTFKNALNISITQYINRRRISFAQKLLLSGISAHKAAELCDYENYTTFFRQYKKYLGKSPMEDRPTERRK